MRILVTGASGQLGYDVERELERRGIEHLGTSSRELDITDREAVERLMAAYRPDAAIHCAAYTKVDLAEDEPERCWAVTRVSSTIPSARGKAWVWLWATVWW